MSLKWRKWVILVVIGLIPILTGCEGCDKKKHIAPPPAPSAPSNLSATAVSLTRIDLTWKDNSTNEKGFYVYRKTTGNYSRIVKLGSNATSYSDSSLGSKGIYWYKVTAYNDGGESGSSNEVSVKMVEILDYHMEEKYFGYDWLEYTTTIIGNVRNNTKETLTIWIAGKFIDQNDIIVKISYDLLENVGDGETWRFEIIYWNEIGERIKQVEAWVDDYYE